MTDYSTIQILSRNPRASVSCLLADGAPEFVGSYGGWTEIARPKRQSITEWQGNSAASYRIPILLDGFSSEQSVEASIQMLETFAAPYRDADQPPILRLSGKLMHTDFDWVINDIIWGDREINPSSGVVIRQFATITFLQYLPDELLIIPKPKNPVQKARWIRTKDGDNARIVARRELGTGRRWKEIRELNPKKIKNAGRQLKKGTRLRIPAT